MSSGAWDRCRQCGRLIEDHRDPFANCEQTRGKWQVQRESYGFVVAGSAHYWAVYPPGVDRCAAFVDWASAMAYVNSNIRGLAAAAAAVKFIADGAK